MLMSRVLDRKPPKALSSRSPGLSKGDRLAFRQQHCGFLTIWLKSMFFLPLWAEDATGNLELLWTFFFFKKEMAYKYV